MVLAKVGAPARALGFFANALQPSRCPGRLFAWFRTDGSIMDRSKRETLMRKRSLLTVLAFATVFAGAGAETAFADGGSGQPTASASAPPTTAPSGPSAAPSVGVTSTAPAGDRTATPTAAPSTSPQGGQIRAVPSGAPNTGVPASSSNGYGEAAAIGASLAVLVGGSGTVLFRRRLKGRG